MEKLELKQTVYSVFSDRVMLALAFIALPIVAAEFLELPAGEALVFEAVDWLIWLAFVLEFVLKVYVEENGMVYIRNNKLDSVVSVIIVASAPVAVILSFTPFPVLGLVRALRIFRLVTYGDKVYLEKGKPPGSRPPEFESEDVRKWKIDK